MMLCRCCFVSGIPQLTSHTQRPVLLCAECGLHWGLADKTAVSHEKMMAALRDSHAGAMQRLDARREALAAELAVAQAQVRALTHSIVSEFTERPAGDVQNMVEAAVVQRAMRRGDSATRARDSAMGAVFRLSELHHEDGVNCSCGTRITACKEYGALTFIRSTYLAWERQQIERLTEGRAHGLPFDHPLAEQIPFFEWKGLPSTRSR